MRNIQHCNVVKILNKSNYNSTNDIFIIQKFTTQINLYFNTNGSATVVQQGKHLYSNLVGH